MANIKLDISNFHQIFRNREINVGDVVENLNAPGSLDLIVKTTKKDLTRGYVVYGHSPDEDSNIIERKYWAKVSVDYELINSFKPNSKEAINYQRRTN